MPSQFWTIEEESPDPSVFFLSLPKYFVDATTAYFEGTSIISAVRSLYVSHAQEGPYLPGRDTIWPRSKVYRCSFDTQLFDSLSHLSKKAAAPEIADHVKIIAGDDVLLNWHDAFFNAIWLSGQLSESTISKFAAELGSDYSRVVAA